MTPHIIVGDLLEQSTDAIVNPWNRNIIPWWLLLPQGVSGAIKRQSGFQPFVELGRLGAIPLGHAVITSAGRLPFKAIIHVAGINMLWRSSKASIQNSVLSAMALAETHAFQSIAFPMIGAGTGGFPESEALQIITETLASMDSKISVVLVRFHKKKDCSGFGC